MADGGVGMSGHGFDAYVSSQRTYSNEYDLTAKIQEKYYRARQKFLAKIEKKEDTCIVLSDSKLDAKLEIYRSIDKSCAQLTNLLEDYQNCLYVYANEENSLGILLKECSKYDKTKAGKIMAITGKSLSQSSHQRIRLYMPLLRIHQEMDTFHSRAVEDTAETVDKLENKRSQYRASLLWMKDISERLDPDIYRQLDRFRRVQNQVRSDKKIFDTIQMNVVQKIDLLMASRCNLLNQILASYQATLLETFERNFNNFRSVEELIKKEDIYEYEFKALKQLNPLPFPTVTEQQDDLSLKAVTSRDSLLLGDENIDNNNNSKSQQQGDCALIDIGNNTAVDDDCSNLVSKSPKVDPMDDNEQENVIDQLEQLFGTTLKTNEREVEDKTVLTRAEGLVSITTAHNLLDHEMVQPVTSASASTSAKKVDDKYTKLPLKSNLKLDLLNMDFDDQIANLLGESENTRTSASHDLLASFGCGSSVSVDGGAKSGSAHFPDDLFASCSSNVPASGESQDIIALLNKIRSSGKQATSMLACTDLNDTDTNLMGGDGDRVTKQPTAFKKSLANDENSTLDLLTNELDDIDNCSYFKSLQRLQL